MKPQDILVLLKLGAHRDEPWTYPALARAIGISASETHASVQRSLQAGLLIADESLVGARKTARSRHQAGLERETEYRVAAAALTEFLVHGLRYVFPAEYVRVTRGVPTAASAPALSALFAATLFPSVWPHPTGDVRGQGLVPVHPSVPSAALADASLYRLLALAELLRVGTARERGVAADELKAALKS